MWREVWNDIVNFFTENGWHIVGFFATLIFGLLLVKILINVSRRMLGKTKMERIAQNFIMAFVKFALYFIWILALLSVIGIQITGILSALSALLLAIGLALQNIISNLANGVVIVSSQLFKTGDYIAVDGVEGSVIKTNFLFTTIHTNDNKRVTIPNSTIVNSSLVNYGSNKTRRVDFMFSVAYETDVELVKSIVIKVMESNGKVLLTPKAPFCRLKVLNASSIDFAANCWCDGEDYWDVYYYVVENVYNEFKRNNISIPYNQLEVRTRTDEVVMPVIEASLPTRVEKVRTEDLEVDFERDSISEIIKKQRKMAKRQKEKYNKEKQAKKAKQAKKSQ